MEYAQQQSVGRPPLQDIGDDDGRLAAVLIGIVPPPRHGDAKAHLRILQGWKRTTQQKLIARNWKLLCAYVCACVQQSQGQSRVIPEVCVTSHGMIRAQCVIVHDDYTDLCAHICTCNHIQPSIHPSQGWCSRVINRDAGFLTSCWHGSN